MTERIKSYAILRKGFLWSRELSYTREGSEERIRKVCEENGWDEDDFSVVEASIVYENEI